MICNFSYKHYEEIIKNLKESHEFLTFEQGDKDGVILRHDIDMSLESALEMAKIEQRLGVKSTYFVLFHADWYQPFTLESSRMINQIVECGHRLGLHFDMNYYIQNKISPDYAIQIESLLLETHFYTDVKVFASHNERITTKINGLINANDDVFAKDRKYLSDSVQNWREGCICDNYSKYKKLTVLIHPVW